ncbi:hypothetical protein C8024_09975 [Sphingopyxis sp. BSNA05]|uniref:hypothetical protein n=1 Tax=Sphingopyxis sp. BSNA05 TaxID=1236614 RepID=UPI001566177C|nr:hypothetical protein [Sphingopyxis sp. BSNA05]NRD89710.1 hypothetical protein [Sphingopyxis sp. BSNA05]
MAGMALGDLTRQAMHARLSVPPPVDPVERYALGQNAYEMPHVRTRTSPAQPAQYNDAGYEIGRYENGARILVPEEPARKRDRLRMERLQAWNDENFGAESGYENDSIGYAGTRQDDGAPIDVGAVMDAPEMGAVRASGV